MSGAASAADSPAALRLRRAVAAAQIATLPATSAQPQTLVGWVDKPGYSNRQMRRRYVRLDATNLSYYKSDSSSSPQGTVTLTAFCFAKPAEVGERLAANAFASAATGHDAKRPFGLSLVVPEKDRTFYFYFSSARERLTWLNGINSNTDALRRTSGGVEELVSCLQELRPPALSSAQRGVCKTALRRRSLIAVEQGTASATSLQPALDAIAANDRNALCACLTSTPALAQSVATHGSTLLHEAAARGAASLVQLLLEHGANVDAADSVGDTALILAARHNHVAAVRILLEQQANVSWKNKFQETAFTEANHSPPSVREMLISAKNGSFKSQTHHVSLTGAESAEEILSIQLESLRQAHNTVNEVMYRIEDFLQLPRRQTSSTA